MATRSYGQYCGLARALEIVGERWSLLIIRDLLVGARRFTDLHRGLPRIPTNVLSARLKELEAAGVIGRRVLPRPASSVVYELTEYGRELEEVILRLGRWGAASLGEPEPDEIVTADSLTIALRATFRPEMARRLRISFEIRLGPIVLHARVADGTLEAGEGPLPDADLRIETGPALRALMAGELSPAQAIASGRVRLAGDVTLLTRFVQLFSIPPVPTTNPA